MQQFDVVVIGAGVAGLTAAAAAARRGLKVGLVEPVGAGGQIMNVEQIENFPGFPQHLSGYDLGPLLQEQAEAAGAEFLFDRIEKLEVQGAERILTGAEGRIRASAVVIATGSAKRRLGVPGEDRLQGRGVSHCAACDGPLFRQLEVVVVGGGDAALDEALVLAKHASRVTIVHRAAAPRAQQYLLDRAAAAANVELVADTEVDEIMGDTVVTGVALRNVRTGALRAGKADGVFVYIGLAPHTAFLDGVLRLDADGRIETDLALCTSLDGVFAAGDVRAGSVAQLAAAAGDGSTAALSAYRYIQRQRLR